MLLIPFTEFRSIHQNRSDSSILPDEEVIRPRPTATICIVSTLHALGPGLQNPTWKFEFLGSVKTQGGDNVWLSSPGAGYSYLACLVLEPDK